MQLEDIVIALKEPQNFNGKTRLIGVDLRNRLTFPTYTLSRNFANTGGIGSVNIDVHDPGKLLINVSKSPVLNSGTDDITVEYSAYSVGGETVDGRIIFKNIDFDITLQPIAIDLDHCCDLPDDIIINVRNYNRGLISLVSVGANNANAGTIMLSDVEGSDYNDDHYNDDFGMVPNKLITYNVNKGTSFWKTMPAEDTFTYTAEYNGKTAESEITIRLTR